ncbi:hypothetical protein VFPBJ_05638 [Purpureocillium lilacinum]|uniref:Uncharacterized protein n=1 Tax=Purpureocillium lilacinum TaxID=33203 RepID=A0A179GRU6_PURLI|nr:hypothetical protein VFPBJ_05638 [Purpureocillium lilacinum]
MPRPRYSGSQPESFNLRWHSVVDPATPSADIMSSPDPLNDQTLPGGDFFAPPSSAATRRVTRSQRSQRFLALSSSPRKQMFELQVGDRRSPQRLLVTVETEDGADASAVVAPGSSSAIGPRRKLFQSPTPRSATRRRKTPAVTTTTVPLRDTTEEADVLGDAPMTPRRRGRPRKSNGTPMPSAAKRRAGTPAKSRTPRRPRTAQTDDEDPAMSEASIAPTPKSGKPGRPRKNPAPEAPSETGTETTPGATRQSKRRRHALAPEELVELADAAANQSQPQLFTGAGAPSENEMELVAAPSEAASYAPMAEPVSDDDEPGPDMWMDALDDDATPRAATQEPQQPPAPSSPTPRRASKSPRHVRKQSENRGNSSQAGDYLDLVPAPSDVSSVNEPMGATNDTIAQGEDFSMIFMDSIPSLQGFFNSSIPPRAPAAQEEELGEETSLIINNTLETLRQSVVQRETSDQVAAPEPEKEATAAQLDSPHSELPRRGSEPRHDDQEDDLAMDLPQQEEDAGLEADEDELAPKEPSPTLPRLRSFARPTPAPRWSSSPRKGPASSPLRYRVLRATTQQAQGSPSPRKVATTGTPRSGRAKGRSPRVDAEASNAYDDSFSEIPQDILEAATPGRHLATAQHESDDEMEMDEVQDHGDSPEVEEDELQEAYQEAAAEQLRSDEAEVRREETMRSSPEVDYDHEQEMEMNEQEADHEDGLEVEDHDHEHELDMESAEQEQEHEQELPAPSVGSSAARSDAGRLPTPDDTLSQPDAEDQPELERSVRGSTASSKLASPMQSRIGNAASTGAALSLAEIDPDNHPEPLEEEQEEPEQSPEGAAAASEHSVEATPVHQISSPMQEPHSLQQETLQDKTIRPALSAIVRAGRMLQSITSDPPSPEGREKQLGSPFRSSGSKESWNGSRDSQNSQHRSKSPQHHLLQPMAFSEPAGASSSPAREVDVGQEPEDEPEDETHADETHGDSAASPAGGNASLEKQQRPRSRESAASSIRISPASEAMSWVVREGPISPRLRGDVPLQHASHSSTIGAVKSSASHGQPDEAVDEPDELSTGVRDDETDIWELEALRESPPKPTTRQQPFGKRTTTAASLRRRGMASPWRKKPADVAARLVAKDTPAVPEKEQAAPQAQPSEADEYSLLRASKQQKDDAAAAAHLESASKQASRFELSSFFSSPAAIPGMLAQKFLPAKAATATTSKGKPDRPASAQQATAMPTSSMFPQIPQKEFHPSSSPRRDLFSPARSQPAPAVEARPPPPRPAPAVVVADSPADEEPSSPATPERIPVPITVTQKQNFTPRPRQASQTFFQPSSQRTNTETPPRMQLSHEDIHRWQQETSNASEQSSPRHRDGLLRPLPPKNASPTKSSLRSPLKPRTPGRVVEFTSSVLSPAEQARVRQERRISHSFLSEQQQQEDFEAAAPSVGSSSAAAAAAVDTEDKENSTSNSASDGTEDLFMSDAVAFQPPPPPPPALQKQTPKRAGRAQQLQRRQQQQQQQQEEDDDGPLSLSVWSRGHWLLLDAILQRRRQGPLRTPYPRRADRYLGKTVKSQGEAMRLERWHLDCVDAFRAQVGGWDEGALAKRLFALILGEEQRERAAAAEGTTAMMPAGRVMFH